MSEQEPTIPQGAKEVQEKIEKSGKLVFINGVYGDVENCTGVIEDVIISPEGGKLVKCYGCSYLFKGYPDDYIIEGGGMSLAKAMISEIPRNIISKSLILKIAFALMYITSKRKFYEYLAVYFNLMTNYAVHKSGIFQRSKLNKPAKAIYDAIVGASAKEDIRRGDQVISSWLGALGQFVAAFIEFDSAYRFRMQDIIGEINKENAKKNPRQEALRLVQLLEDREHKATGGIGMKWSRMKIMVWLALTISSDFRRIIQTIMLDIDVDKAKLDEDDWYFCLNRIGYKFKGISHDERLKIKKQIDIEKGHFPAKGYIEHMQVPKVNIEVPTLADYKG